MNQVDTRVVVLDAEKGIVGGYFLPWSCRRLDGAYALPGSTGVFLPDRHQTAPVYVNHDYRREGIAGYVTQWREEEHGMYATAQLTHHPLIAPIWADLIRGEVFWSYDHDGEETDADGQITATRIVGLSLTGFPYWRPADMTVDDYLALCEKLVALGLASGLKRVDRALLEQPILELTS